MRKVIVLVLFLLIIQAVPTTSEALRVMIGDGANANLTTTEIINGKTSIRIAGTYTQGSNSFTISNCTTAEGCSGFPARVYVDDGNTVDNLVLTDAKITAAAGATSLFINSQTDKGDLTDIPAGGPYPHAIAINGVFIAATLTAARSNSISVAADVNNGNLGPIGAPTFSTALSASFNKQATANFDCLTVVDEDVVTITQETTLCSPLLRSFMTLVFQAIATVRLPGSISVVSANVAVEDGGLAILARALDDLQPGIGPKIYDVRMQPSPGTFGSEPPVTIRGVPNSTQPWLVARGGHQESKTEAELRADGIVKVRAQGLCPADISSGFPACSQQGQEVHAALFCGQTPVNVSPLVLDQKGAGDTTLLAPMPCADPAVLITDRDPTLFNSGATWLAAPGLF